MIDNDWSNDGMVMIQRYGLGQQQVAVDAFLSSAAAINHLFLREPRGPKVKCPPHCFFPRRNVPGNFSGPSLPATIKPIAIISIQKFALSSDGGMGT